MISLDQIRAISPSLAGLSDEELSAIRFDLYGLGKLALEAYREELFPKIPVGSVALVNEKRIMDDHG